MTLDYLEHLLAVTECFKYNMTPLEVKKFSEITARTVATRIMIDEACVKKLVSNKTVYYENVYIDLPTRNGEWNHVALFATKELAIAYIREHIGHCDDDGKISLHHSR